MQRIYVHGLGQTAAAWEKTLELLGPAKDSVCPNLADLLQGQEASYTNLYSAFSKICDGLDGASDLCGLSLGGILAMNYAIDRPEKVRSLVLIAAQYKMPKNLLRFQNILFRFMPNAMFRQTGFGKPEFLRLCETMAELDFSASLPKVTCPVLVLCGEKDSANRRAATELAGLLRNAEFQTIPGAGHEANIEAPEKLAEILRGFYNRKGETPV